MGVSSITATFDGDVCGLVKRTYMDRCLESVYRLLHHDKVGGVDILVASHTLQSQFA